MQRKARSTRGQRSLTESYDGTGSASLAVVDGFGLSVDVLSLVEGIAHRCGARWVMADVGTRPA